VTTGDALYEAILAAPADDLPRLVYADWLEEHGDAERAEFIRAQIAGNHARANPLLERNRAKWSIPNLQGVQSFARGFVDEVWTSPEEIVLHHDELLRLPLCGLRISAASEWVELYAGLPVLAGITCLDLSNNTGIHNRFDRLFYKGGLRNLTSLTLRNARVWSEDLTRWPMIPGFPNLTSLNLAGNPIGNDGLAVLANHPGFASLHALSVRGDGQEQYDLIGNDGVANLARSDRVGRFKRLDLSDNVIEADGVAALARSDRFTGLKELNLSENPIGPVGLSALARWPQLATVDSVDMRKCRTTEDARAELLASPWASKFILDEPTALV
jgi:uncharacterized protein (TIGR02996 family)